MQFLSDRGQAPSDALYSFTFGGNDVRDALAAGGDPTIIGDAVMAITANLLALCEAGARDIVVSNVANVGVTPAVRASARVVSMNSRPLGIKVSSPRPGKVSTM